MNNFIIRISIIYLPPFLSSTASWHQCPSR